MVAQLDVGLAYPIKEKGLVSLLPSDRVHLERENNEQVGKIRFFLMFDAELNLTFYLQLN